MATSTLATDISTRIAERLAREVGQRRYELCFEPAARLDFDNQHATLRVAVPSRFIADRIERDFGEPLARLAAEELGHAAQVAVAIDPKRFDMPGHTPLHRNHRAAANHNASSNGLDDTPRPSRQATPENHNTLDAAHESANATDDARPGQRFGNGFNTSKRFRHRLEGFVTGPSNELAYAAATRLAQDDQAADPVFLHGGCGLGKTHLLQGACARMLERSPRSKVWYTTGEQFTNTYIQAVRKNELDKFRSRVRHLDLLAVDDVHFIANKDKTQQEFLHCFDAIDLAGARLMLASDCHPKQIEKFSEALVSRCVRGLVVEVRPPDSATRRALIVKFAQRRGLNLRDEAAETLANRCVGSVRDLEGLLTKLHALASLTHHPNSTRGSGEYPLAAAPLGHALLDRLFATTDVGTQRGPVRFEVILQTVCDRLDVPAGKITGSSRHKHVVLARALVIHLTRVVRKMSYPEIAAALGKKSHSTVITADKRMEKMLASDERLLLPGGAGDTTLRALLDELRATLARA